MHTYTYQLPLVKSSTKSIQILDATNEPVYTMKRTYKSIFHKLFDAWIGQFQFLCEYEGRNQQGKVVIQSKTKHILTKPSQSIIVMESNEFCAHTEGGDAFTPTYTIEGPDVHMKVKIDFNNFVQFYENGHVIAKLQLHLFSKSKKSELEIEESATIHNPLFYTIFAQMFYFVGDF